MGKTTVKDLRSVPISLQAPIPLSPKPDNQKQARVTYLLPRKVDRLLSLPEGQILSENRP